MITDHYFYKYQVMLHFTTKMMQCKDIQIVYFVQGVLKSSWFNLFAKIWPNIWLCLVSWSTYPLLYVWVSEIYKKFPVFINIIWYRSVSRDHGSAPRKLCLSCSWQCSICYGCSGHIEVTVLTSTNACKRLPQCCHVVFPLSMLHPGGKCPFLLSSLQPLV